MIYTYQHRSSTTDTTESASGRASSQWPWQRLVTYSSGWSAENRFVVSEDSIIYSCQCSIYHIMVCTFIKNSVNSFNFISQQKLIDDHPWCFYLYTLPAARPRWLTGYGGTHGHRAARCRRVAP